MEEGEFCIKVNSSNVLNHINVSIQFMCLTSLQKFELSAFERVELAIGKKCSEKYSKITLYLFFSTPIKENWSKPNS